MHEELSVGWGNRLTENEKHLQFVSSEDAKRWNLKISAGVWELVMEAFTTDGFHTGGWGRSKKLQTTSDQWTDCHYWVTHLTAASNEPKHRRVLGLMKIQPVWLHSLDYPSLRNTANNKQISQNKSCNKWLCRFLLRPHQQHSAITEAVTAVTATVLSLVNHYQTPTLHIYRPNGGGGGPHRVQTSLETPSFLSRWSRL